MSALSNGGRAGYRRGVEQIAADCRLGLDVAFVAEGDPTLFSTAAAVLSRARTMALSTSSARATARAESRPGPAAVIGGHQLCTVKKRSLTWRS